MKTVKSHLPMLVEYSGIEVSLQIVLETIIRRYCNVPVLCDYYYASLQTFLYVFARY